MIKKLTESLEKAAVREGIKKGALACPQCGAKNDGLPDAWEELLECKSCGNRASLIEWAAADRDGIRKGRADVPPPDTKIRKEGDGLGGMVWSIPATGKFGAAFFFSIVWLGGIGLMSGGFLFGFFTSGEVTTSSPEWLFVLFVGIFWLIGFAMLRSAIRKKFLCHRLAVSGGDVVLTREMFGRKKSKLLPVSSINTIAQKVFYKQNYTPVYGIEIKGGQGKLRFGTALTGLEKAWLVADLSESVFGVEEVKSAIQPVVARKEVFSIALPGPSKLGWVGGLIFTLMSVGFFCIGLFVIDGEPLPGADEKGSYLFHLVSSLFENGFRSMWLLMTGVFTILGIYTLMQSLRGLGVDRKIEGNSAEISLRSYKRGLIVKDQSFPRNQVTDIRASSSGSSNGRPMKRVELIVGNKAERISWWMDGNEADALVAQVRAVLG